MGVNPRRISAKGWPIYYDEPVAEPDIILIPRNRFCSLDLGQATMFHKNKTIEANYAAISDIQVKIYSKDCNDDEIPFMLTVDDILVLGSSISDYKERLTEMEEQAIKTAEHGGASFCDDSFFDSKYLRLLKSAKDLLFEPERVQDPKRKDAKKVIYSLAKEQRIEVSENVVSAIFTIIKPDDHNPKKRKG